MFKYLYDNVKDISPVWWILLAFLIFKNFRGSNKIEDVEGSLVEKIDDLESFNKTVKEHDLVIVDMFATWCGPCVRAAPIFAKLSIEYPNIKFVKVDVDVNTKAAKAMEIKAMPTFIIFQNGNRQETVQGFSEANIKNLIKKYNVPSNKKG